MRASDTEARSDTRYRKEKIMEKTKRTFLSGIKAKLFKDHVRFRDLHIEFKPAKETIKIAAIIAITMLCLGAVLYGTDTGTNRLISAMISAISGS